MKAMQYTRVMTGEVESAIAHGTPGLYYLTGDATDPYRPNHPIVIAHIVNDIGAWGAGFTRHLTRRSPRPERFYRAWAQGSAIQSGELRSTESLVLGHVQIVTGTPAVANLCAQHDIKRGQWGADPIRYEALRAALNNLHGLLTQLELDKEQGVYQVHMPRIGAGLAGGDWDLIEPIIQTTIAPRRCVAVYDLPPLSQR